MEQVVNLDNARMLDNYRKILDEKKKGEEKTVTELRNIARRRASDGISVKTLSDLNSWLKDLAPVRIADPNAYEQEKTIDLPLLLGSLNIKDSLKSRSELLITLSKIETEFAPEVNSILGVSEQDLTIIDQIRKLYALDYSNSVVVDLETGKKTKLEGFKLLHADHKIYEGKKELTIPEYLLKHSLLRCIDGYTNDPQMPVPLIVNPNIFKTTYLFNNWKGFRPEVTNALPFEYPEKYCSKILEQIRYSVSRNKEHEELSLNYMAHMLQKPWEKPGWAILYKGREGCGKDIIARILGKMMHPSHWVEIADSEFKKQGETAWKIGNLLVNVTDFDGLDKRSIPHIYPIIESDTARIREMYLDTYSSKSIARFILTTNSENAIPAKLDTRRFFIPEFDDSMGQDNELDEQLIQFKDNYWDQLYAEAGGKEMSIVGEGVIAFYQLLMRRDISKFNVKHPRLLTKMMGDLVEANRSSIEIMIDDIVYTGQIPPYGVGLYESSIPFEKYKDTMIEASVIKDNYVKLFERMRRERGNAYPSPGRLSRALIEGLGLPYDGPDNNKPHLKMVSKTNSLNYIFPPLTVLRDIYFKKHPRRKRPLE